MHCTTKLPIVQLARVRLHALVVFSILILALMGGMPDSEAGWIICPPQVVMVAPASRRGRLRGRPGRDGVSRGGDRWLHLLHTCHIPLMRSLLLWALWHLDGQVGPSWVRMVPWVLWLWQRGGHLWPWLRRQPEWRGVNWLLWQAQRLLIVGYLGLALGTLLRGGLGASFTPPSLGVWEGNQSPWALGLGCVVCGREEPWAEVVQEEDGSYVATLCGHFTLRVSGGHPFRKRLLMIFLRLLEVPGPQRGGRRTREGRTPFVAQEKLAACFEMPQPDISRNEKYWLEGDWPNLLNLKTEMYLPRLTKRARLLQGSLRSRLCRDAS